MRHKLSTLILGYKNFLACPEGVLITGLYHHEKDCHYSLVTYRNHRRVDSVPLFPWVTYIFVRKVFLLSDQAIQRHKGRD